MKSIKVGPYEYTIELTDTRPGGFDTARWGDIRHDYQNIRILTNCNPSIQLTALMHESLHAIGFVLGTPYPDEILDPLAAQLVQFLQDNGVDLSPLEEKLDANRT